ncbi:MULTISPECIES: methyl-accepting chemotaxis protein [Oxalobacteraceae]|uniref:methyl-accepting chemotaxis protein n=1 Tax=Herminiimonas sp. Marseille-P9896 TaxID=2742211 RepID=UPI00158C7E3A|nr:MULTISPECIES: methyl-accepting chemotaxis protein [Oxalobacteraceae]
MINFSNMKIGTRLTLGFGVVLALSIAIAADGIHQLHAVSDITRSMLEMPIAKERMVSDWSAITKASITRTISVAKSADPSLAQFSAKFAADDSKQSMEIIQKLEPLLNTEQEKALYAKILDVRKTFLAGREGVMKLKTEGKEAEAAKYFDATFLPAADSFKNHFTEFVELERKQMDAGTAQLSEVEAASARQLMLLSALVLAFGMFCAWRLTIGITRPLKTAVDAARRVAGGDLTNDIKAESKDECGQLLAALKDMNDGLQRIVGEVRLGTDAITTASNEIAAGNMDLSSRTEQQASSLEETASSMEELTSTVKQNADNARQANQLAASASEVATKGGEVVSQVVETMSSINESSRKIVDIISVIDGIAFQTNILALNAAVEAARAGEQGRGFAVVATEVRSLAQRSASAAKEIKALIGDSVGKVDTGNKLVTEAGATMDEIVSSIRRVTDIMGEITAASQEQSAGIEQINQAIGQMDHVTQQNASLVEEAAAAAESMQDQARKLGQVVGAFKLSDAQAAFVPRAASVVQLGKSATKSSGVPVPAPQPKLRANGAAPVGDEWEQF